MCTDVALTAYAAESLDVSGGSDVVVWVVVRHHHEPRYRVEDSAYLPDHYEHFSIVPRGLRSFRRPPDTGSGDH